MAEDSDDPIVEISATTEPTRNRDNDIPIPRRIGKYRVTKLLGKGGFGRVYLAHDESLDRHVAIKVPIDAKKHDEELYRKEAKTLAQLNHANIIQIYGVHGNSDFPVFIVSEYVDGSSLRKLIAGPPELGIEESLSITTQIAKALAHAHQRGVYHRDVKPANILLDRMGKPYLADFGVAISGNDEFSARQRRAGTVQYMSPEQVGGEGHLVDGRTDIFSLGVVLYELLTGRRPFAGTDVADTIHRIRKDQPPPMSQINREVPEALEHVCMKALEKRIHDRYPNAFQFATELKTVTSNIVSLSSTTIPPKRVNISPHAARTPSLPVIPKGLKSFDAADHDFFLQLLPGARRADGTPESIWAWKERISATDPMHAFRVGVVYGPSGSGKSSFVKAGLIPSLDGHVKPVYVEADANQTESRLRQHLGADSDESLSDLFSRIRLSRSRSKTLIIIDQFEQWLHGPRDWATADLISAIRQCDAKSLQCLLCVRDDFCSPAFRFLDELDQPMVEGKNIAMLDLFSIRHTEQVLKRFGQAYGSIPVDESEITDSQRAFFSQSARALSQDDQVICVNLAIFAEIMKDEPWTPDTLEAMGGVSGIGRRFLEKTFGKFSPYLNRLHRSAAIKVLSALVPSDSVSIKSMTLSNRELQDASGYRDAGKFGELLNILDQQARIITPIHQSASQSGATAEESAYKLTHDSLVAPIREWTTREKRGTARGRAELVLQERAADWARRPISRNRPSFLETARIALLTQRRKWTHTQKTMMRKSTRYWGMVAVLGLILVGCTGSLLLEMPSRAIERLAVAQPEELNDRLRDVRRYRYLVAGKLRRLAETGSVNAWKYDVALLADEPERIKKLAASLLDTHVSVESVKRYSAIRRAVCSRVPSFREELTAALETSEIPGVRMRAAAALASNSDTVNDPTIEEHATSITEDSLLAMRVSPGEARQWCDLLVPIAEVLFNDFESAYRSETRSSEGRLNALKFLLHPQVAKPDRLLSYFANAQAPHFKMLVDRLRLTSGEKRAVKQILEFASAKRASDRWKGENVDHYRDYLVVFGRSIATLVVAAIELGGDMDVIKNTLDGTLLFGSDIAPVTETALIHRFHELDVRPDLLVDQYRKAPLEDAVTRRLLILALSEYSDVRPGLRTVLEEAITDCHNEPNSGVHSALQHLARVWHIEVSDRVTQADRLLRSNDPDLIEKGLGSKKRWFPTDNGYKLAIAFMPDNSVVAIGTTEVTRAQFGRFRGFASGSRSKNRIQLSPRDWDLYNQIAEQEKNAGPDSNCPQTFLSILHAIEYCKWLSQREGLDSVYHVTKEKDEVEVHFDYRKLGYRLPTVSEWTRACTGGVDLSFDGDHEEKIFRRFCGPSEDYLQRFAWYVANSQNLLHPVAQLKPNVLGQFDVLGNAFEFTLQSPEKPVATGKVKETDLNRILGGSFTTYEWHTSHRQDSEDGEFFKELKDRNPGVGFRIVRTLRPS